MFVFKLCRSPKGRVIHVSKHALGVIGIGRIDRPFVLVLEVSDCSRINIPTQKLTESTNPSLQQRVLSSLRSSSTEISLEVLFSQCQRSGPIRRVFIIGKFLLSLGLTQVDPYSAGSENTMDNLQIVNDIFRLKTRG